MIGSLTRRTAYLCLWGALASQAACTDLPTGTDSFQFEAGGQIWVAVMPPDDLPDAGTWLSYAGPDESAAEQIRAQVLALQQEATRARSSGDLELANALLDEAAERAVDAMEVSPPQDLFVRGIASLETWQRNVRSGARLPELPALAEAVDAVGQHSDAVEAALREGDLRSAALRLTEAAMLIRKWSPDGVALSVLDRVDSYLAAEARSSEERDRAAHLVRSARHELIGGDPLLAMQRALYALQIARGNGLSEVPSEERSPCGEYGC